LEKYRETHADLVRFTRRDEELKLEKGLTVSMGRGGEETCDIVKSTNKEQIRKRGNQTLKWGVRSRRKEVSKGRAGGKARGRKMDRLTGGWGL